MADITEKLLSLIEETELPRKGRGCILDGVKEIKLLRGQIGLAEAEIVRLREGLRKIRCSTEGNIQTTEEIDGLLKIERSEEF